MANICRRNPSVTKLSDVESRKLHEQITATAIEFVAIDAVKRNPRNAKQHPEQQVLLIAENIRKFGVNHPLQFTLGIIERNYGGRQTGGLGDEII